MTTRRLAAILAADVVGFSSMMEKDEEGTLGLLKTTQRDLIEPRVREHHGRIVKTTGDGFLIEFGSPLEAVRCALEVQEAVSATREPGGAGEALRFRMGINLGDIIIENDGDIYGDGVNVATRLEQIAEPGSVCISGKVFEEIEGKLPTHFAFAGEQTVKNLTRPVRVYAARAASEARAGTKALPLPDKPSIAVLPFTNLSGDPEQEYFADGVVEEIITALSRFRWLFVIARNSSLAYKGKPTDVKQVGRELGVRYVLEGTFRKAAGRVRITGQLIEASTGRHVWGDRFDGGLEDIFALQDEVTSSVVGALAPRLQEAEIERVRRKPTESLDAYENYLRGLAGINRGTEAGLVEALPLLYRAIELDPQFASAYGVLAETYTARLANGWTLDAERELPEALRLARKGIELDRNDPVALAYGGLVLSYIGHEFENGAAFIRQALELNPNFAAAWDFLGFNDLYQGDPEAAIEHQSRAMRLSPFDPRRGYREACIAYAHLIAGRYDEAASWARAATRNRPHFLAGHRVAAASNALVGRMDEAHASISVLRQADPTFRLSNMWTRIPFRRAKDRARLEQGLRKAGLPE